MLKIAITGPESVGKSTLTKLLAEHFHGKYVTEFARDYVASLNRPYTYEDVEIIARKQMSQYDEKNVSIQPVYPAVFFDTFLMITKVWFNHVWHRSSGRRPQYRFGSSRRPASAGISRLRLGRTGTDQ